MWVLLLGLSIKAETVTIDVDSENTLASQIATLTNCDHLIINGELTAADFTLLNSGTYTQLADVTTLDLSGVTVVVDTSGEEPATVMSTIANMKMGGMEYLRLPDGMTTPDDVEDMASLKTNNTALKMVGSYKDTALDEFALYSFKSNNVQAFQLALMKDSEWNNIKIARLAGIYGTQDLDKGVNNPVFSSLPAEWDFTGANFESCTVAGTYDFANNSSYYSERDPFEEGEAISSLSDFKTNAFYYFKMYAKSLAKLTLPDQITELPPFCLDQLCTDNKENYKLYYGITTDNEFAAVAVGSEKKGAPLENLVIPNSVKTIGYECAFNTYIKKISFGSGLKVVQGGAFKQVQGLEDIEFSAGISNCYLGDEAFQLCYDVKHVVLSEGIVSLGAGCFQNSQQLESIRLPETLEYIGNDVFRNCLALGSITIPPNVKKIGMRAFVLTALRDVYLTTTDPDGVPEIFTVGTSLNQNHADSRSTFGLNELEGYNTIPFSQNDAQTAGLNNMTWDEAVQWYYLNVNCMAVLHFPDELADRVRARISGTYGVMSIDGYGLPIKDKDGNYQDNDQYNDIVKRATGYAPELDDNNPYPTADLGTEGAGKFSKDGWAQFLLMKEYVPGHESIVYSKKYKDVWYTMCFPFELTDEQLAAAFNEGFNIADFSGVQIKNPDNPQDNVDKKTLVLHFNKVAETLYKDPEKRLYERKMENGKVVRESHGTGNVSFDYNVYIRNGQEYHHVIVATGAFADTKTKTFAPGNNLDEAAEHKDQAVIIDGFLASAGHPYMIHPNTGTVPTAQPVNCYFSGITWIVGDDEGVANGVVGAKTTEQIRDSLYTVEARTIDLGVEKKTNNFDQKKYDDYAGQTYTFKGNFREYNPGADLSGKPDEVIEPQKPQNPNPKPDEPETVAKPDDVTDPDLNTKYADVKDLFKTTRMTFSGWTGSTSVTDVVYTYLDDLVAFGFDEFFGTLWNGDYEYRTQCASSAPHPNWNQGHLNQDGLAAFKTYLGDPIPSDITTRFAALKSLAKDYKKDKDEYDSYGDMLQAWQDNQTEWENYRNDLAIWNSWEPLEEESIAYNNDSIAYQRYLVDLANWKAGMAEQGAFVVIPKGAYFLGTKKGDIYPKYWLETSSNPKRSTGLWSQYAAIIIPNTDALNGIEKELGQPASGGSSSSTNTAKGYPIAFDEDYDVFKTPQGITTLIEKIEKEEGKAPEVEYMDIVVSIDGKIVSRDKTTFEGLPKGVYIINGKKYYVK